MRTSIFEKVCLLKLGFIFVDLYSSEPTSNQKTILPILSKICIPYDVQHCAPISKREVTLMHMHTKWQIAIFSHQWSLQMNQMFI